MKTFFLSIILSVAISGIVSAQGETALTAAKPVTKSELQKERKEIQDELKQIQDIHKKLKDQTRQSLSQLTIMKRKMDLQERYVAGLGKELRLIDEDINRSDVEISRLLKQLDTLKSAYAKTAINPDLRSSFSYVNFIFSASLLPQVFGKLSYLKSYKTYREKQISTIRQTKQLIYIRTEQKTGKRQQRNKALQDKSRRQFELSDEKRQMNSIIAKLKANEKDLKKEIEAKKKRDEALEKSILAVVKKDEGTMTAPGMKMEDLNKSLAVKFENNKGDLPWPVEGIVTIPYGPYKIEGTKLVGDSPGLTISTSDKDAPVKAVFDGIVSGVDNRGEITTVYINHGKYYTVYSNLATVNVTKGATVKTGQVIGAVGEAYETEGGELIFILMAGKNNDNPAKWLSRH
jgi:septal ring factor EnvC (AmiA/AmiB activator)